MGKPIAGGASNNIPYLVSLICAPRCHGGAVNAALPMFHTRAFCSNPQPRNDV